MRDSMLGIINRRISGCRLEMDSSGFEQPFTKRWIHLVEVFRVDDSGGRCLLRKFEDADFGELEGDLTEFLFDLVMDIRLLDRRHQTFRCKI